MALYIQKFGGTSVGSLDRIRAIADIIAKTKAAGHDIVVVVSAMAGETDRLIELVHNMVEHPDPREYAVALSTGEQVSMALTCMALHNLGHEARSYTGAQAGIMTDDAYARARIQHIHVDAIRQDLAHGRIVVVAGFQGVDDHGNITTLGRGGSDTTAVALAAALEADECQIYTDVDGVYTADPRVVEQARRLTHITFEEMLELSSLGAKVLQIRAVEFAGKYNVPLRVLSSFEPGSGTLITYEESNNVEQAVISGIAFNRSEAKLTVTGLADVPGIASKIIGAVSAANIDIDMIIQNIATDGKTDFTFTVHRDDYAPTKNILETLVPELGAAGVKGDNKIAKLSLVGVGMRSHAGIASKMFATLAAEGINIQMISTSEIKVSVIIDEKYVELGARALHTAFGLDQEITEEFDPHQTKE